LIIGSSIAIADTSFSDNNKASQPGFASINPDFVKYQQDKIFNELGLSDEHENGSLPSPVDLSHLSPISSGKVSFPAYYDLRTMNKVTSVKRQGYTGSCWAFATYGSLESYLLPVESWDFSENNLKNVLSNIAPEGFDFKEGGNPSMSTAYLARWSGPVDEKDDPYRDSSTYLPDELGLPIQKHVQEVIFLPARQGPLDNNGIKSAIQKYGAIDTSIYYCPGYYSFTKYSYYYSGSSSINHDVTIVGWDDSYDRNNFSQVPPGNGAFIVKNSRGTTFGEKGYFYVSYYDSRIGERNTVFTAESKDNYNNIYQYDPLGWTSSVGCNNPTYWGANVFTAKSSETLKAVSFYATDSSSKYQIYIYTNPTSGPISNNPVLTQNGTTSTAGYHTVKLSTGIPLKAGQKFSVVLKLTTPNLKYPIATETPIKDYSSKAIANSSESFVSCDGSTWYDMTSITANTNVCIKAFTKGSDSLKANFSANPTSGKAPLKVQFTDKSTGTPTSWRWVFEDGKNTTVKTSQNTIHTYYNAGTYTVKLTVTNDVGSNTTTKTNYIIVTDKKPVAAFSAKPTEGKVPLEVIFIDKSTGLPTSWSWNFGDGNTSTAQNPTHKYTKVGKYTVSLTVKNTAGSNTITKSNCITVLEKPVAAFSASPNSGNVPLKVTFTDKSTNNPASWKWAFGDGKSSTDKNPTHTYIKEGKYNVSLTVTNVVGSNTTTKTNYVTVKKLKAPKAAFSASPTSGSAPLKVTFTDKSTNDPASWSWNFGDGSTSTAQKPTHTYSKIGNYTVRLIVKNPAGSSVTTITNYIRVTAVKKPVAVFSASPTSGKAPLSVKFTDKSINNPTSWAWKFGDGSISTVQNPTHKYTKKGTYTVSLTVKNAAGSNSITKTKSITVK